jgi:hypothetical protein
MVKSLRAADAYLKEMKNNPRILAQQAAALAEWAFRNRN